MKGTAVFKTIEEEVVVVEEVDQATFIDLKTICNNTKECQELSGIGKVMPITFMDSEVDWEYGY